MFTPEPNAISYVTIQHEKYRHENGNNIVNQFCHEQYKTEPQTNRNIHVNMLKIISKSNPTTDKKEKNSTDAK